MADPPKGNNPPGNMLPTKAASGPGFLGPNYSPGDQLALPGQIGVKRGGGLKDVINAVKGVGYYTDMVAFGAASTSFTRGKGQKPLGVNYFINTGSYYSYLLRQTQFIETFQNSDEIKSNTTLYFKRNELGVSAGFGISYSPKMPIIISFELRNNLGLTNLSRLEVYNDGTVKTNSVSLLLGVCYKISKLVK